MVPGIQESKSQSVCALSLQWLGEQTGKKVNKVIDGSTVG